MRLFLAGGGSSKDSQKLDKLFAESIDNTKPLLYIPIAIDVKEHPYKECFEWINSVFNPLGVDNIIMWTDLRNKDKDMLNRFSGIYIGGGNTFFLMRELRDSELLSGLKEMAEADMPIYGWSAGAVIFSKSIIPALSADKNQVKLKNLNGLNLIKDCEMWCHYDRSMDSLIREYQRKYKLKKIVAIPENAGILVTESGIRTIGPGNITIFNGKKKIIAEDEIIMTSKV